MESTVSEPIEPDEDYYSSLQRTAEDSSFSGTSPNKEDMSTDQIGTLCNLDTNFKNGSEVETPQAIHEMATRSGDVTLDSDRDVEDSLASTSFQNSTASFAFSYGKVQDESMDVSETMTLGSEEQEEKSTVCSVDDNGVKVAKIEEKYIASFPETQSNENSLALSSVKPDIKAEICPGDTDEIKTENQPESFVDESVICEDSIICEESIVICENLENVSKMEICSEDEEVHLYTNSGKSGAESSSSKDESPSGPSCSGTSRAGLNSLSSDSEDDLPSVNFTLPIKKRKRETQVEVLSNSSCSDDESKSEIDYANLTPEEIKALIEEAKRFGSIKRCKCPKKKWSELPIIGPIETSSKCTIGKGDWREKLPCEACSSGACTEANHKPGRRARRRGPHQHQQHPRMSILARTRARGTIGQDVPVIDLSDSEEVSSVPNNVASEVTITAVPAIPLPSGECIVLSSSEDDDDIVCEGVVWTDKKNQATRAEASNAAVVPKEDSPDVVTLSLSTMLQQPPPALPLPSAFGMSQVSLPAPQPQDTEPWPDFGIDLENWDDTINLLANIVGPTNADGALNSRMQVNASAAAPDRPSTPEGWSCPICLESKTAVIEIMSTTCGHVFCGNCIRSAVKIHKKCPTCRKKLTLKQFHRIFL